MSLRPVLNSHQSHLSGGGRKTTSLLVCGHLEKPRFRQTSSAAVARLFRFCAVQKSSLETEDC